MMSPEQLRIRNLEDRLELMEALGKGDSPGALRIAEQLERLKEKEEGVNNDD